MSLRDTLEEIQEELVKKDRVRQELQTSMRKATKLSKQAIFLVHKAKLKEAEDTVKEAGKILATLGDLSGDYPDFLHTASVESAYQEYAEARVMIGLVKEKRFVNFKDIGVSMTSYVLGLADAIGEFRRRALDFLRKGKIGKAEECLELMEAIYADLINLDEIHFLIAGLRRKCDVARRVIEATRGDITIEVRRGMLERSMRNLKETLEASKRE